MARKRGKKAEEAKDQPSESTKEANDRPKCFGTFEKIPACLRECSCGRECAEASGVERRRRIPSRKRAISAFCRSCNGGSAYFGCPDFSCPFYCFLTPRRQLAGEPDFWWERPALEWDKAEEESRRQKRVIKQDTDVEGPDEDLDDDQDDEEEEDEDGG